MPTKILFVPFHREPLRPNKVAQLAGDEFTGPHGKNARWKRVIAKRKGAIAKRKMMVTDDTSESTKVVQMIEIISDGKQYAELKGLQKDDQVYIRGHCMAGLESIFSFDDLVDTSSLELRNVFKGFIDKFDKPPKAEVLPAPVVANRLIASGLQQGFSGVIKCFNCHSGEPVDDANFSRAFVTHLHKRGYTKCTVYGYIGALDSYPGTTDWNDENPGKDPNKMHTYATQDYDFEGSRFTKVLGRASKNRVVATPYT